MGINESSIHSESVATRDVVPTKEGDATEQVFVTAVERGVYLRRRERGETFGMPRSAAFGRDGKIASWLVEASDGDIRRSQEAVEVDMARAHASPRYEPANSPESVRAANAARAAAVKAREPAPTHDETPEVKAARLQAEEKARTEQAERDRLAAEETANRNREQSQADARSTSPAARSTPDQTEKQADASIRVGVLREEASKLEAAGGKDNKKKAQELREEANKLERGEDLA